MRKLSHFVVCCMLCAVCCMVSGCGKEKIRVGNDLKVIKENNQYRIEGSISSKNCLAYNLNFELQNGDIRYHYYYQKMPANLNNELFRFSIAIDDTKLNDISNLEEYQVKVKKIECIN